MAITPRHVHYVCGIILTDEEITCSKWRQFTPVLGSMPISVSQRILYRGTCSGILAHVLNNLPECAYHRPVATGEVHDLSFSVPEIFPHGRSGKRMLIHKVRTLNTAVIKRMIDQSHVRIVFVFDFVEIGHLFRVVERPIVFGVQSEQFGSISDLFDDGSVFVRDQFDIIRGTRVLSQELGYVVVREEE
uniref:Uncharacterized protein n=2 Tax=Cacopsylla melanoneura TaxID=428564 RepID=A0A8D8Z510_9HEMI